MQAQYQPKTLEPAVQKEWTDTKAFVAPDASYYPVAFTASPVLDDDGRPVGTVIEARGMQEVSVGDAVLAGGEAAALVLLAPPGSAKTLRLASAFDPQTQDPHALALLYQSRVVTQIYEGTSEIQRNTIARELLAVPAAAA